jgi:glycogen debranching enzyme
MLKVGSDFYILASSLASRRATRVLANGESFVVFETGGDILESPLEALGFFCSDTRYLSRFELRIAGETPYFLNSYLSDDNAQLRVNLTNPDLRIQGGAIHLRRDEIQIERSWVLADSAMFHRLRVRNYARSPLQLPLEFAFAVDFADLFEVRGVKRKRRGDFFAPKVRANSVTFSYKGLDKARRIAEVVFQQKPHALSSNRASFLLDLKPDAQVEFEIRVTGRSEGDRSARPSYPRPRLHSFDQALTARRTEIANLEAECARIETNNELFDSLLRRSAADLTSIVSRRPSGTFMMAGIPWFGTLFGRDSALTAMSMLPFNPSIASSTLRVLASLQGSEIDEERDEQPGKIVHEIRAGEMAATREIPFGRYYGSVDSTPLFIWLYGRYVASTGDLNLAKELWPNIERALEWIEKWGDRDGDGYVEYLRERPSGLANQGWKDSVDAISHADGRLANPPIAPCEVQGYVYAGLLSTADVALRLGRDAVASRLAQRAVELRTAFTRDFWLDEEGTVSLALDGDKKPCRVMSSNAAHCMATGLLDRDQSVALAKRLLADDMFSGWGVRTLSAKEKRYNPMSYHNGSVWPHDNAITASGLAHIEGRTGVLKILEGLLDAATQLKTGSLPELFCGFPREPRLGPVPYPVACHPQAWSAASVFMILQAMLGMRVVGFDRKLVIDSPVMPQWLDWLRIENLRVGDGAVSLYVQRTTNTGAVEVIEKRGSVSVEVRK